MEEVSKTRRIIGYSALSLLIILFIVVIANPTQARYAVVDWYRRATYTPSTEIEEIVQNVSFTDEGRSIFFATQPTLHDKTDFSEVCPFRESANVLGCYSGDLTYLLDVDDEVLDNVEEVTAVHELLHGVWARMDAGERKDLTEQLISVYESSTDERLITLVNSYMESNSNDDPDLIPNELHSILATEVEVLTPELEEHYSAYLEDRQLIVTLFNSYDQEFERREQRLDQLERELASLRTQIAVLNSTIDSLAARNEALIARINELRSQGRTEESNQLIPEQNSVVAQINASVSSVNRLIDSYNAKVQENNDLAFELNQLAESLSSRTQ